MSGPETRFYTAVHKHLPPVDKFHREKMANPYRSGTADHWYSGNTRDLWVEWKWVDLPKRSDTVIDITAGKKPSLSKLQEDWITSRRAEGRDVWLIVGSTAGGLVLREADLNGDIFMPRTLTEFLSETLSKIDLAHLIYQHCQR